MRSELRKILALNASWERFFRMLCGRWALDLLQTRGLSASALLLLAKISTRSRDLEIVRTTSDWNSNDTCTSHAKNDHKSLRPRRLSEVGWFQDNLAIATMSWTRLVWACGRNAFCIIKNMRMRRDGKQVLGPYRSFTLTRFIVHDQTRASSKTWTLVSYSDLPTSKFKQITSIWLSRSKAWSDLQDDCWSIQYY